MSWAEDQPWYGMEDVVLEEQNKRRQMLNGFIHEDKSGNLIDVRTIDKKYAKNLYNWYLKKNLMPEDELKQTVMMKELYKIFILIR